MVEEGLGQHGPSLDGPKEPIWGGKGNQHGQAQRGN